LQGDLDEFTARDAEILALGPGNPIAYRRYWESEKLSFVGLPDPKHTVANLYNQ
jgi:peroxiredoxin